MTVLRAAVAIVLAAAIGQAAAQQRVSFPSQDGPGNAPVVLIGYFFPAPTSPAPAVALFHGCGGAYDRSGALAKRMREYAELFNGLGLHALVVGGDAPTLADGIGFDRADVRRLQLIASDVEGDEIFLHYRVLRGGER